MVENINPGGGVKSCVNGFGNFFSFFGFGKNFKFFIKFCALSKDYEMFSVWK
jgi:hypothetical protein